MIGKHQMAKHFGHHYHDRLAIQRRQDQIEEEAAFDGIYVLRTPVPDSELDAAGIVAADRNLKYVERDFWHIKADDLDLRPVLHQLEKTCKGPRADLHARRLPHLAPAQAWARLTYTDEDPPSQPNPVGPCPPLGSGDVVVIGPA